MKTNKFGVLIHKELIEQIRSGRFLILAVVFVFFAIASPLMAKYLPAMVSSMMKDQHIYIKLPESTWKDAIAQFTKNISQMGVLILILLNMGTVAKEKETGTAVFLLVKPVSRNLFILSKYSSQLIVLFVSMVAGYITAVFYINVFFGSFPIVIFTKIVIVLLLYLIVIQFITIFYSILVKTSLLAGLLALGTTFLLGGISLLGKAGLYSPNHLLDEIQCILKESTMNWQPFVCSAIILLFCVIFSQKFFRNWES
jgi:ABC-2 type transport system permease protein